MLLLSCMDKGLFSGATVKVCNNFYTVFDGSHARQYAGVGMQIKKTGTTKVSFKVRCGKKIYNCKTTVKVVKYANPFKKILLDNTDITKYYNHKFSSQESSLGKTISLKPNKNWRIKSCYLYKNGKKLKKLKGSSYTLPEDTSMTLTMTNKKTKVVETLKFDYADFDDYEPRYLLKFIITYYEGCLIFARHPFFEYLLIKFLLL